MRKETQVKDCKGEMIFEGDTIECDCPIFVKPKQFKVIWDDTEHRYNVPKDAYIRSFCKKVKEGF